MIKGTLRALEFFAPLADLCLRLWVANVFFKSGMNKFASMDTTFMLFQHEYKVPLLDFKTAAYLGTGVELIFPVLLALGILARFSAGVLFVFNIIAVISYPGLWDNQAGMLQHLMWGIMLAIPLTHGPGKLSIDHLIRRRFVNEDTAP